MDITPEIMASAGVGVVMFVNGELFEMFNGEILTLLGQNVDAEIELPYNQMPIQPKKPLTIQQDSVESWEVSEVKTVEGGESRIPKNRFKKRQHQQYAMFLRDTTTPNRTNPLLQGRELLTVAMKLKIKNNTKEDTALLAMGVNYVPQNLANNQ
jgi:hypothetical protein